MSYQISENPDFLIFESGAVSYFVQTAYNIFVQYTNLPFNVYGCILNDRKARNTKTTRKEYIKMKFVLYIDYKADYKPMFSEYKTMSAKSLEEAIEEADKAWNENIYLARIMKKVGNVQAPYKAGYKYETYEAILCRRSFGWHRNTEENCEDEHIVHKNWLTTNKEEIWFEIE